MLKYKVGRAGRKHYLNGRNFRDSQSRYELDAHTGRRCVDLHQDQHIMKSGSLAKLQSVPPRNRHQTEDSLGKAC
jgi:hypothetical protein